MEKNNLNLVEILKGQEGIELWTKTHGYLTLIEIDEDFFSQILLGKGKEPLLTLTREGKYSYYHSDGECLVFPDKNDRDWKNFSRVIPLVGKTYTTRESHGPNFNVVEAKVVYKSIENKFLTVYTDYKTSEVVLVAWVDEKGKSIQSGKAYDLKEI